MTTAGEPLTERQRFALEQAQRARTGPWSPDIAVCYPCARELGRCRYGLYGERPTDDGVTGWVRLTEAHEGGPDVAHGGVVMAVLDEISGTLVLARGHLCVTKSMTVEFLRPVPIGPELAVAATVEAVEGTHWTLRSTLTRPETGQVLARGRGVWVVRDIDHWTRLTAR